MAACDDYKYDIAYLTAKPLMRLKNGRLSVAAEIDVMQYVIRMRNILDDSKAECRFFHEYATREKLHSTCAVDGCKVLHLTLSGSTNGQRELLIEHETKVGTADTLSVKDVINAFGDRPPELLIVFSKHAEKLIHFFEKCNVPHVVGMRYEYQTKDPPVLEFKKHFYQYILSGYSVKKAFENAYTNTRQKLGIPRWLPEKFHLAGASRSHNEVIFPNMPRGKYKDCTIKTGNYKLPMPVQNFNGRNHSMFELLSNVLSENQPKLTWVYGTEGFGKTGLVTMAAHYCKERKLLKNILYVDVASSAEEDLSCIVGQSMRQKANAQEDLYAEMNELMYMLQKFEYHQDTTNNSSFTGKDWGKKITNLNSLAEALSSLKEDVLLILDSILENGSLRKTLYWCSKLLSRCSNVRLLCISRVFNRQILDNQVRENKLSKAFRNIKTFDMKPMAETAALRLLLYTRQPSALHNEFGPIHPKEREQIVAQHPCGILAQKYHVPLAVKRIAQIMDRSNLYFCTVSIEVLELIIKDLVPFHVYLHRESANYYGDQQILRNNGLAPCNQLPPFALDLLNGIALQLNKYQQRHVPQMLNYGSPMNSSFRHHPPWGGSPASDIRRLNSGHSMRGHDPFGPTPMGPGSGMNQMRSTQSYHQSHHNQLDSFSGYNPPSNFHSPPVNAIRSMENTRSNHVSYRKGRFDPGDPESSSDDSDDDNSISTSNPSSAGASTFVQQLSHEDSGAEHATVDPRDWTKEEVADWLGGLGAAYERWKTVITVNGIDGMCMKDVLTDDEMLVELGISSRLNRKVIMKKTKQLFEEFDDGY